MRNGRWEIERGRERGSKEMEDEEWRIRKKEKMENERAREKMENVGRERRGKK